MYMDIKQLIRFILFVNNATLLATRRVGKLKEKEKGIEYHREIRSEESHLVGQLRAL